MGQLFLSILLAFAASLTTTLASDYTNSSLFPNIVDTSHASYQVAQFFHRYFVAKSLHNATELVGFFNPAQTEYFDGILGLAALNHTSVEAQFVALFQGVGGATPNALSYPVRVLGDTTSGLIEFVDRPGLFGEEIRTLSSIDFQDGTVTRQVDYWDGRGNPVKAMAVPDDQYPTDLGLSAVKEQAASQMIAIAHKLNNALSTGNVTAATALFSYDAIWEDDVLHVRQVGQLSIGQYLQRVLPSLPYGPGTTVSHVLGSARGGGYEWRTDWPSVRNGITGLELDGAGQITRFSAMWDGSRIGDDAIEALAVLSVEV